MSKYVSRVIFDVASRKDFETRNIEARSVSITTADNEKLEVILSSDTMETLGSDFKVKIDESRSDLEIAVVRNRNVAEEAALEGLDVEIIFPKDMIGDLEFKLNCNELTIKDIECRNMEFGGIVKELTLENVSSKIELDIRADMTIRASDVKGSIEINQISSKSVLEVPSDFSFRSVTEGTGNEIRYEKDGAPSDDFSDRSSETTVELNGRKSILTIRRI